MAEDPPSDIYSMCGGNVPARFDLDETQIEDLFPFSILQNIPDLSLSSSILPSSTIFPYFNT